MSKYCIINGKLLPEEKAVISVNDIGLTRSYAVFDYMRTYNGKPFALKDHLNRLRSSAKSLYLKLNYADSEIEKFVHQLIEKNKCKNCGIRFLLTGGESIQYLNFDRPNFIIVTEKLPVYPSTYYANGVKLVTFEYQREVAASKTTDYLNALRLTPLKQKEKAFDILYFVEDEVLELTRNNIFIVKDKVIATPKDKILHGITRKHIIKLAKKYANIKERKVTLNELYNADEVFISGTSKKIIPVNRIDHKTYSPIPGEITLLMMKKFDEYISEVC